MIVASRRTVSPATWMTACLVLVVDLSTKQWALSRLSNERVIDVVWTLRFNLHFNSGVAFSQLTGFGEVVGVAAIAVAVFLISWSTRIQSAFAKFAVGLVVGGAVGNVIDRLFREEAWLRGRVVDFIDFQWFPIFNVADMGVSIGATMLILHSFLVPK